MTGYSDAFIEGIRNWTAKLDPELFYKEYLNPYCVSVTMLTIKDFNTNKDSACSFSGSQSSG